MTRERVWVLATRDGSVVRAWRRFHGAEAARLAMRLTAWPSLADAILLVDPQGRVVDARTL